MVKAVGGSKPSGCRLARLRRAQVRAFIGGTVTVLEANGLRFRE